MGKVKASRFASTLIFVAALQGGHALSATPAVPPPPPSRSGDHAILPASQLMVAAVAALTASKDSESSLGATAAAAPIRAKLAGVSTTYNLLDSSQDAERPRMMRFASTKPGTAFLRKVPVSGAHTYYVLATADASKLAIWSFYEGMPGDQELLRDMVAAGAGLKSPLAKFDPSFVASSDPTPARYILK